VFTFKVTQVSVKTVLSAQAYLLFYVKPKVGDSLFVWYIKV